MIDQLGCKRRFIDFTDGQLEERITKTNDAIEFYYNLACDFRDTDPTMEEHYAREYSWACEDLEELEHELWHRRR